MLTSGCAGSRGLLECCCECMRAQHRPRPARRSSSNAGVLVFFLSGFVPHICSHACPAAPRLAMLYSFAPPFCTTVHVSSLQHAARVFSFCPVLEPAQCIPAPRARSLCILRRNADADMHAARSAAADDDGSAHARAHSCRGHLSSRPRHAAEREGEPGEGLVAQEARQVVRRVGH